MKHHLTVVLSKNLQNILLRLGQRLLRFVRLDLKKLHSLAQLGFDLYGNAADTSDC